MAFSDNGAEIDVVNVTEETTSVGESAEFDGGDAVIAAEVVLLNEDVIPTKSWGYVSKALNNHSSRTYYSW